MFIEKQIPNRRKNEKLILFLRRHWIVIVGHWLFYGLLIILPLIIYFLILRDNPQLAAYLEDQTTRGLIVLLTSSYFLFAWLFFYYAFIDFYLDVWIVTNKRIINIEQSGLFNRRISEHELEKIQDVTGEQKGIIGTFLTFGDVKVQTASEVPMFIFKQINDPFEVVKTINHLLKDLQAEKEKQIKNYWQQQMPPQKPIQQSK